MKIVNVTPKAPAVSVFMLNTREVVPWIGHEKEHCVVLKATLEVSE